MRRYPFVTVDVFTSKPLEGNPLAVFTDAHGLSDSEMQALARKMNLSETTFVCRRSEAIERERGVQVRIFNIGSELEFAGHPTLGTAFVLADAAGSREIVLDLKVGRIPVRLESRDGTVFGEMTQRDPEFGEIHHAEEVAQASGIALDSIDPTFPIQTVTTGNPFAIVPLKSLSAIRALQSDPEQMDSYLKRTDARRFYFVTREVENHAAKLHARMLFFGRDDPATGSAAGPTAAWMVKYRIAQPDEQCVIEQGIEAKRPSRIFVRASRGRDGSRIHNARVAGHVLAVIHGEVALP